MSAYAFEKTDEGWRAMFVEDNGNRLPIGPCFPTQTEAVLFTLHLDQAGFPLDEFPCKPSVGSERCARGARKQRIAAAATRRN